VRAEGHDATLTVPETTQFVYQTHELDKPEILGKLLQSPNATKMMIFTRTKRSAQRLADDLVDRGFNAVTIHGDLTQQSRERSLKRFRKGDANVLVATDVAARGIDVTGVSHVVNYECPDDEKTYVHRIGRTGRAGASGVAVTFIDWADVTRWKVINKALDLPFAEIAESYSTTRQLLDDLGIPDGLKGRIAEEGSVSHRERGKKHDDDTRGRGRGHDGHKHDHSGKKNGDRDDEASVRKQPRGDANKRQRRRTRNGELVKTD
jgi:superfamily II DNA/RNA helicase